jgi:hypothetical protein
VELHAHLDLVFGIELGAGELLHQGLVARAIAFVGGITVFTWSPASLPSSADSRPGMMLPMP